MNVEELKETIDMVQGLLAENAKVVTPETLTEFDKLVAEFEKNKEELKAILDVVGVKTDKIEQWISSAKIVLDYERKLIESGKSAKIIDMLSKLEDRPLILGMITRLL
jgi:malate synthase